MSNNRIINIATIAYLAFLLIILAIFGYTPTNDTDGYLEYAQVCLHQGEAYPCSTLIKGTYNPQNEMFSHFGTKRYNFKNETQLFKVIPHTSKNQKKSTGFAGTKYI